MAERQEPAGSPIGLGIDAGGTYTDAVIRDMAAGTVLAKSKALTTYHDYGEGIRGCLEALPRDLLARVRVTSLSTTLATNAMVENRGHRVGMLVLAPWTWFVEEIDHRPIRQIVGAVDIGGTILHPFDPAACATAARELVEVEGCDALVVAGYALNRNPAMALAARQAAHSVADVPIVCAHEVSHRLNAVQSARTAVANARLLPLIRSLLASVRGALDHAGVRGKLLVVKGDGTPVLDSVAMARPIETVLSGPAASVSGALALTGFADALVMDVGGTTTDCAVLEDGHVAVAPDGARVGDWLVAVDVAEICTAGLGGDSRISFASDRSVVLGPQRSVPICRVAQEHPHIARFLAEFPVEKWRGAPDASCIDVLVSGSPGRLRLSTAEQRLYDLVRQAPIPAMHAAERTDCPSHVLLPTERLEAAGMIKRASLTPTCVLHTTGSFVLWDATAANRALLVTATIAHRSPEALARDVLAAIDRRLYNEAIRREVTRSRDGSHTLPDDWSYLMDRAYTGEGNGLRVRVTLPRPIVAIGAPASVFVPGIGARLGVEVVVPEHAEVANAVGAIAANVTARETVVIQPSTYVPFVVFSADGRAEFDFLEEATEYARAQAQAEALRRVTEAGAQAPEVVVSVNDSDGDLLDGTLVFLERRVVAVASGSPFG